MDTGMGIGWLMSSLVKGGITREESDSAQRAERRRSHRRYRGARSAKAIEAPSAIVEGVPPVPEVIGVGLTDIAAEKVNHGRAR